MNYNDVSATIKGAMSKIRKNPNLSTASIAKRNWWQIGLERLLFDPKTDEFFLHVNNEWVLIIE